MLSVVVHKDVAEYQPKLIAKLSTRMVVCIGGGIGMALLAGVYITFVLGLNIDELFFVPMLLGLPFWAAGFYRPKDMKLEQYIPLYLRHTFTTNQVLYSSTMYEYDIAPTAEDLAYLPDSAWIKKKTKQKGIEGWCPSEFTQ